MYFKHSLYIVFVALLLPGWAQGQGVVQSNEPITPLKAKGYWLATPKYQAINYHLVMLNIANNQRNEVAKLPDLTGFQNLSGLKHKTLSKVTQLGQVPQQWQAKAQQKLENVKGAPKKLSRKLKKKLGKLQAAQKLVDDLEGRTGGKLNEWTKKLTVPEMRQLKEAKNLLKGLDKDLQKLVPKNLANNQIFKDLDKWTKLEGLKLNKLKDVQALQSLQKLDNLGKLNQLKNFKGLNILGKYGQQVQQLAAPYAEKFSMMQKLTQQYQGGFPGNMAPSALKAEAKKFLAQHQGQLKAAQEKLAGLKQKYQSIASTRDLKSGLKRKSLKGQGSKRLILGGKFDIASYVPFSLDLAPRLGYRFDKRLSAGIMGGYRKTWGDLKNISLLPESFHYAGFLNYTIVRSFYAYGEIGQSQVAPPANTPQEQSTPRWERTLLVGLGKSVRVGKKISLQTLLLHNLWHNPAQAVYPSRWVIRFGMQWDLIKP
ncbi:MAG TPA: hypothetical protein DCS93_30710 [Microscillaceae bacterium]|nr:hypothetical protein [Microscillaceae bacterium]